MVGVSCESVAVEVVVECPRCHVGTALPGAVSGFRCAVCTERVPLAPRWWDRVLFRAVAESLALPPGKGRTARIKIVPGARLLYGPYRPRCDHCHESLPVDDLMARVTDGTAHTFCPECGERIPTRAVPLELRSVHPMVAGVIGERLDDPPARSGIAPRWYLLLQAAADRE